MSDPFLILPTGNSGISEPGSKDMGTSGTEEGLDTLSFFLNYLQQPIELNVVFQFEYHLGTGEKILRNLWQLHR